MNIPPPVTDSLAPFSPLFDCWMDENTGIVVRAGRISLFSPNSPRSKETADSLKNMTKVLQGLPPCYKDLNPLNLIILRSNLLELTKRITSYNKSVEGSFFHRILDFFLRFLGYEGLKCEPLAKDFLPELNRTISGRKEQLIETLTENPSIALNNPRLGPIVGKITGNAQEATSIVLHAALVKSRELGSCMAFCGLNLDRFTTFKVALFIEFHRALMTTLRVGKESASRHDIGRIKLNVTNPALVIEYDKQLKQILIIGKSFAPGSFKAGRCVIDYANFKLFADMKVSHNPKKIAHFLRFEKLTQNESNLMQRLKDAPHIVKLLDTVRYYSQKKRKTIFRFLMPFYNQGDLFGLIKRTTLTPKDKLTIARDILLGILELHSNQILHRDIKPENIFVERIRDEKDNLVYRAFIGDLGLAVKNDDKQEISQNTCGSPSFFPLEILKGTAKQSETSDLWALGLTLYHLYTGTMFVKEQRFKDNLIADLENLSSLLPKDTTDPVVNAILGFLKPVPAERSRPEEVLKVIEAQLKAQLEAM